MVAQRYTNFYKRTLLRGCLHNLEATADCSLVPRRPGEPSAYVTEPFDTRDTDTVLGRLMISGEFQNARLEVIVAAADSPDIPAEGEHLLFQMLADPATEPAQKAQVMTELRHVRVTGATEFPLYSLKGRYVWIYVGILPIAESRCQLDGIRLELPKASFLEYFPEIYQNNDFFERYIAMFESLYLELERRVDELPRLIDYENTGARLTELAQWLGLGDLAELFSGDRLREVIRRLEIFQAGKGTRAALAVALELETGRRPRIVEHFHWSDPAFSPERRGQMDRLYGERSDSFCVILEDHQDLSTERLERLIRHYSPIGTTHQLVRLHPSSHADVHCYLDINSALAMPKAAAVGGMTLDGRTTAG